MSTSSLVNYFIYIYFLNQFKYSTVKKQISYEEVKNVDRQDTEMHYQYIRG